MAGVNKVIILGRLGKDPELRALDSGSKVCTMTIATSESYKNQQGERQEKTEWHSIILWNKLAELADSYLQKGREVYIEGKLQTRSWEDQTGQKKYKTEIMATSLNFVGSKSDNAPVPQQQYPKPQNEAEIGSEFPDAQEDDLPF